MNHVVLLGDSTFDGAAYVHQDRGEKPVIDQLQAMLPPGWTATLLAVDGHVTRNVCEQLQRVPCGATHLVISVGGNDALAQSHLLSAQSRSMVDALEILADKREQFRRDYRDMLSVVCALDKPTLVASIYDCIPWEKCGVPVGRSIMRAGIAMFNDVIIEEAVRARLPLLDLRRICSEDADFAGISPIEPSAAGAAKIARAIWGIVRDHEFAKRQTVLFGSEVLDQVS